MVWAFLKSGIRQMWVNKRALLIFYFSNLLTGMILTIPVNSTLNAFIGDSLMGDRLAGKLDMHFLIELIHHSPALPRIIVATLLFGILFYLTVSLFLSGGIFFLFVHQGKYTSISFWGNAAHFFGRFCRLFLWMIPLFLLLVIAVSAFLGSLQDIIFGNDPPQYIAYWGNWLRIGFRFLGIVLCYLVFDYARIYIVQTGERSTRLAFFKSLEFVFTNLRRTFTLTFAVWLIGVTFVTIYNPAANWLAGPSTNTVVTLAVSQQLFMLVRTALKLTLYAGEVSLFKLLFFNE